VGVAARATAKMTAAPGALAGEEVLSWRRRWQEGRRRRLAGNS